MKPPKNSDDADDLKADSLTAWEFITLVKTSVKN